VRSSTGRARDALGLRSSPMSVDSERPPPRSYAVLPATEQGLFDALITNVQC
jgi:hypothetical protein